MPKTVTYRSAHYTITLSTLGASIIKLETPDKEGHFDNIVFSYQDASRYDFNKKCTGATVGPLAGRVYPPVLKLSDTSYPLNKDNSIHLHSGTDNVAFIEFAVEEKAKKVIFSLSPSKQTFPACDTVRVIYEFFETAFSITYETHTDHDTYCSFTNHSYFNLSGTKNLSIASHTLKLDAKTMYALDADNLPVKTVPTDNTVFDFSHEKPLSKALELLDSTPQRGLDHCFLLEGNKTLHLKCDQTGRTLTLTTSYPSVVIYTNNFPSDDTTQEGNQDTKHGYICFETQYPPNDMHIHKNPQSFQPAHTVKTQSTTYSFKEAN